MFVTGVRVLAFPKIEIKRKSQKKFQTDFIKRLLERRAGNTVKRKILCTDSGAGSAWLLYQLGTSRPVQKGGLFESGGLSLPATLPVTVLAPILWERDGRPLIIATPGRSYAGQASINWA